MFVHMVMDGSWEEALLAFASQAGFLSTFSNALLTEAVPQDDHAGMSTYNSEAQAHADFEVYVPPARYHLVLIRDGSVSRITYHPSMTGRGL